MKIGFTGTREGMTDRQRDAIGFWIAANRPEEAHHGCCVGADEQFAELAAGTPIVGHPCDWPAMQSKSAIAASGQMRACRKPLDRNHDIVDETQMLIAAPKGPEEQRSGTWATVRYARKLGRRILIVWPDGEVTEE